MTTFGPLPGVRGEGALSWETLDGSHVAEGALDSPASSPSPLLPLFPLCHQLPSVSLVTGVLCPGTRPWGGTWDLLRYLHQSKSSFRGAPAEHPCMDPVI